MAKKKEITVEEKLRALYDLQLIDSRIDEIRSVRGELPLEVEDLEDDIAGLNTRLSNLSEDVANLETDISNKKLAIEESKSLMKKYEEGAGSKLYQGTIHCIPHQMHFLMHND